MKTKIKYFISGILFFILGFQAEANLTSADTITALTSGIKHAYYDVTWCSPHAGRLSDTRFSASADCQKGYFNNVGGVGKMTYKGESFSNGNVALNTAFIPSTRTSGTSFIDFFSGISSVSFEGEGIYTIRILLVDYAYNASKFEFSYKIDKTAPQFQLTSISETHPNIFVDTSLTRLNGLNGNIVKHDSLNESSSHPDTYNNPLISSYTGDVPSVRTNHERQNLYVMYFKDLAAHPFELNVAQSDNYNGYMRNYVAGSKNFDLMPETGDTPLKPNISLNMAVTLVTQDLAGHPDNSQKKYRLRLYDNTVGKSGGKPNYSEIIFYAVKDNTKPNMGNTLAANEQEAIQRLLKFDASTPVWDGALDVSKFISAKTNQELVSLLADTGIGTDSSKPAWYNAGVPLGGGTKIAIEQANTLNSFDNTIVYNNRFNNTISGTKDFSKVDNNRQNGYRKYQVHFNTTGIPGNDKICDNVGNCLNPKLAFRVVANTLATTTSNISLKLPSGTTKIFANGTDSYNLTTQLKDAYGNAIVGVTAVENGDKVIKKADITFNFTNGLYYDQLANSGGKGAIIEDKLSTKNVVSTINTINAPNSYIYFEEKPEKGSKDTDKGTYTFSVASKVPSVGGYPYLKNDSTLKLNSINPKALAGIISGVGIYGDIGLFNSTQILSGSNNFLSTNTQFLTSTDYKNDLTIGAKDNYGDITLNSALNVAYNTLNNRKLEFDFASPAIYGADNFSLSHLINNIGATQKHTKLGYTFSGVSGVRIFEQYLPSYTGATVSKPKFTPGIFNIFSNFSTVGDPTFDASKINTGTTITIANTDWEKEFKTKSSPIQSNYQIAGHGFNMGYISSLNYTLDGNDVKLPSISRNVGNSPTDDVLTAKRNSRFYFPATFVGTDYIGNGDYTILGDPIISAGVLSAMGIAITGMSNSEDLMIVDKDAGRKANLNVGENLTRYDMIKVFKQNIEKNSRGITWCTGPIEINDLNNQPNLNDCTLTLNGEKISFIKGNVDIACAGVGCIIDPNTKRTIIVKDGSTYINSNISTFGKNAQLVLGTIANVGLKNITLPSSNNPSLSRDDKTYGWTFIDPKITNIDAFIVSQGPMVSYDGGRLYNAPTEADLKNQLHIYGSTLSLNTVGGYKSESDSKCPYIVENCDQKNAFIFDLVTLRRYSLIGEGAGSFNLVPSGGGYRSGGKNGALTSIGVNPITITSADTCTAGSDDLRCITDTDYIIYPLFIERDVNASKSPSVMFKVY